MSSSYSSYRIGRVVREDRKITAKTAGKHGRSIGKMIAGIEIIHPKAPLRRSN